MKFLKENWFKLMTGTSMLVFSFAFLMYAVSPSYANYTKEEMPLKSDYALVPLNKDGSINIKISEEQFNEIKSPAVQSVNIHSIGNYTASDSWPKKGLLPVVDMTDDFR
jgi:hypothetical protein